MPDDQLEERWRELVEAVKRVMVNQAHSVLDANVLARKLSLPLRDGSRCGRTFTEDEVLNGDLDQLAHDFYEHYRAGCPETEE